MRVAWSQSAEHDLDHLYVFIAADSPRAAAIVTDRILAAGESLDLFPERGRPGRMAGTRELVVARTAYIIVYTVTADAVFILHVVHGHRLWPPENA